jgi:hypothetical protein
MKSFVYFFPALLAVLGYGQIKHEQHGKKHPEKITFNKNEIITNNNMTNIYKLFRHFFPTLLSRPSI